MKISASIVVYNENSKILQKAIESFLALPFQKELIIVDNSPSSKLQSLCESYEHTHYIFSGQNLGFGAGHNLAFKSLTVNSKIHIIVNPDTYFEVEEIKSFLLWFEDALDVSLATPLVCNVDGSIQQIVREIPTPLGLLKRKLKIDRAERDIKPNRVTEIPFAHGCFMVFKTSVFQKLGGFDEKFFLYMEDVDIFVRAKHYGKTVINANYRIFHEHRKASSKSFKLFFFHFVSAVKFFLSKISTEK